MDEGDAAVGEAGEPDLGAGVGDVGTNRGGPGAAVVVAVGTPEEAIPVDAAEEDNGAVAELDGVGLLDGGGLLVEAEGEVGLALVCADEDVDAPTPVRGVALLADLFGEAGGRVVVSVAAGSLGPLMDLAAECGVPARRVGRTGGDRIAVTVGGRAAIDWKLTDAERLWSEALAQYFARPAA